MEKILILGGARGLGGAFRKLWRSERSQDEIFVTSRKAIPGRDNSICDFSKAEDVHKLLDFMSEWQPHRVFCFPGGGPYGKFEEKSWKDHEWALRVTLLSPLQILHGFLQIPESLQMVLVGSSIAESQGDAFAASYSAAKHGLLGAIESIHAEGTSKDLRLLSPGYMATDMLSNKAIERAQLQPISSDLVARQLYDWVTKKSDSWHLKL